MNTLLGSFIIDLGIGFFYSASKSVVTRRYWYLQLMLWDTDDLSLQNFIQGTIHSALDCPGGV